MMNCVELFAGAGGLAMGVTLAGFRPLIVIERDKWACDTVRENQQRDYPLVSDWPLWAGDIRDFDWSSIQDDVDLLSGGPPCQPFSMGGKHMAHVDTRDMFPVAIEAVRGLAPKAFLIENVKGLTRASFKEYFEYILLQLELPEVERRSRETWMGHLRRLKHEKNLGALYGRSVTYRVAPTLVTAADYGVPQKRDRVFIIGFRADLRADWRFPSPTHSFDALLHSQWVSGEYWERHEVSKSKRPDLPPRQINRIRKLSTSILPFEELPWRTVRDALVDLPDPRTGSNGFYNHVFQDGARIYKGHTGSPLDMPAKTLKAGDHGVPGGENMMVLPDGRVRYFSVREAARIQTFPDCYIFHGAWTETMRQLGNAVPVALARKVASSVATSLLEADTSRVAQERGRYVA